jgi:hypothetical protein
MRKGMQSLCLQSCSEIASASRPSPGMVTVVMLTRGQDQPMSDEPNDEVTGLFMLESEKLVEAE